jgi:hypothetical protein
MYANHPPSDGISETSSPPFAKALPPFKKAGFYGSKAIACDRLKGSNWGENEVQLRERKTKPFPRTDSLSRSRFKTTLRDGQADGLPVDVVPFRRTKEVQGL